MNVAHRGIQQLWKILDELLARKKFILATVSVYHQWELRHVRYRVQIVLQHRTTERRPELVRAIGAGCLFVGAGRQQN